MIVAVQRILMIDEIQMAICRDKANVTNHARKKLEADEISLEQLYHAALGGEMIEDYPNDYPLPGCLTLGFDENDRPVHAVWACSSDDVAILTLVAGVCHKCGERIYDAETYREIERLREKLKRNQVGDLKRIGVVYYA